MVSARGSLAAFLLVMASSTTAVCQDPLSSQPAIWASKPDVAAFEKEVLERLNAGDEAIKDLLSVTGQRTIDNTLVPYDRAIERINSAAYLSEAIQNAHPDSAFRDKAMAMVGKASAAGTALSLNSEVYEALRALDVAKADAATRYYVERQILEFRLSGVDKNAATRARLKELNDKLTDAMSLFNRNISEDKSAVEADPDDLQGLPPDYIASHKPGANGKVVITVQYPDLFPAMTFAKSEDLRRRLIVAFENRGYPKNAEVLKTMLATRSEIASLLGYPSWADYSAADKMIGAGSRIADFIAQLERATRPAAEREFAMLLEEKRKVRPEATEIWDYDRAYYSELLRRSQYDFDSQSVRPYFPYNQVRQGILDTAARFFRLTFKQEPSTPAWDPDVETWDVFDDGKVVGRFYLDMHPRAGKFSHAAMFPVLDGVSGRQLPEALLICNLPKPTGDDPGLNNYSDVVTFFHEFGHLMHWILAGRQKWAGISGLSMDRDFVEAPSQMLEEFIRSPKVLAIFAKHYKTGEAIPQDLVERMNRALAFGRARYVALQNAYSAVSYDLYRQKPESVDPDTVWNEDLRRYSKDSNSPGTHAWASFGHLSGYSSSYYTYMWDKVIAVDLFAQFDKADPFVGDAPSRYRRAVLEPGGSMSANDLVRNFLSRPHNTEAFERWMGEEFSSAASGQAK